MKAKWYLFSAVVLGGILASQVAVAQGTGIVQFNNHQFNGEGQFTLGEVSSAFISQIDRIASPEAQISYRFNLNTGAGFVAIRDVDGSVELSLIGAPGTFEVVSSAEIALPIPDWVRSKYPIAIRAKNSSRFFVYSARMDGVDLPSEDPIYGSPIEFFDLFFENSPTERTRNTDKPQPQPEPPGGYCYKINAIWEYHEWTGPKP